MGENPTIDFLDKDNAWVLEPSSQSSLWHTSDGGKHWTTAALPVRAIFQAALSFVDPNDGYLMMIPDTGNPDTPQTILYSTGDAGSTWTKVARVAGDPQWQAPPERPFVFLTSRDGLLISGRALQTHDGGQSWTPIDLPRPADIPVGALADAWDPVIAGSSVLVSALWVWQTGDTSTYAPGYEYLSRDFGRTWTMAWPGAVGLYPRPVTVAVDASIWFRFPDYLSSIPGDDYSKTFSVTRDGGSTWTAMTATLPPGMHFDVESFSSSLDGWAVISTDAHCPEGLSCPYSGGLPGQLVETIDGGLTWRIASAL
jgi:photosystem II stability/assembly factor-like uncharacterized protein